MWACICASQPLTIACWRPRCCHLTSGVAWRYKPGIFGGSPALKHTHTHTHTHTPKSCACTSYSGHSRTRPGHHQGSKGPLRIVVGLATAHGRSALGIRAGGPSVGRPGARGGWHADNSPSDVAPRAVEAQRSYIATADVRSSHFSSSTESCSRLHGH